MKSLNSFACLVFIPFVSGMILPEPKTDGSVDGSSLLRRISMLEQSMVDKASDVELEQLRAELTVSQKDLTETRTKLAQLETDFAVSQNESAEIKMKLIQVETDFATSEKEFGETKTKLVQVQTDLTTSEKNLADTKSKLDFANTDIATSQKVLSETKSKLAQMETDLTLSQKETSETKTKLALMETDVATSQKELVEARTKLAQLETNFTTSQKEASETKIKLAQMETNFTTSQKEASETKSKLALVESDVATSEKELAEARTKLTLVESKLVAQTDELDDVKENLNSAETEIEMLKNLLLPVDNTTNNGSSQVPSDGPALISEVSLLKTEVSQLQSLHNESGGVTFIRWGRTSCTPENNIVYTGYTGGTYYKDTASSASILCLPDQPIYANHTDAGHDNYWGSHIYGTEYDGYYEGAPYNRFYNEDIPCVVCESTSKSFAMMIPARNECFSGWFEEYSGYLMGPSYNAAAGEYVCMDADAEVLPDSEENKDGQILFPVEGKCGSLPCPPYHDNWELTCVVCSK